VPYIIDQATEKDIEQISEACINVFFRYTDNGIALPVQENVAKSISPLKYVQLMYLRLVQRQVSVPIKAMQNLTIIFRRFYHSSIVHNLIQGFGL